MGQKLVECQEEIATIDAGIEDKDTFVKIWPCLLQSLGDSGKLQQRMDDLHLFARPAVEAEHMTSPAASTSVSPAPSAVPQQKAEVKPKADAILSWNDYICNNSLVVMHEQLNKQMYQLGLLGAYCRQLENEMYKNVNMPQRCDTGYNFLGIKDLAKGRGKELRIRKWESGL